MRLGDSSIKSAICSRCSLIVADQLGERYPGYDAYATRVRFRLVPFVISVTLVAIVIVLQPVMDRTILWSLPARTAVVLAFSGPVSMLLGCCFPIGARLNDRTPALTAWMWGINGACGVLASVGAVAISMWIGIDTNLWVAAALYLLLTLPLLVMAADRAAVSRRAKPDVAHATGAAH